MFSETVDIIVSRSNRVDRIADIAQYVNAVIRSMHVYKPWSSDLQHIILHPDVDESYAYLNQYAHLHTNGGVHGHNYAHNHPHVPLVLASHAPNTPRHNAHGYDHVSGNRGLFTPKTEYKWQIPAQFNKIRAVRYDGTCVVPNIDPSLRQTRLKSYYYVLGMEIIFRGFSRHIEVWLYTWSPNLNYFQVGKRPAVWDRGISQWSFLAITGDKYIPQLANENLERIARKHSGNWILRDWQQVVIDGALMRLYRASQDDRAQAHERSFREGLLDMQRSIGENAEHGGYSNL
jgi:hypothetical protein